MLGSTMGFCYVVMLVVLIGLCRVCADMGLSKLFGNNINNEDAWGQLMKLENCPKPQSMKGTIIMVNESLIAGAKFLANPNVTSRYECEFECCYKQKDGCNIAVYTSEQKHCYLFNCGQPSICRFDQRSGYTVSLITEVLSAKETTTTQSTTEPVTKPLSTTVAPPKQLHLLDGCRPAIDKCVTSNTHCSNKGFCMCKEGFHPKNGVCRKNCLHGLEFECTNGDPKYAQPDCIAVYDACDGTPQCPDGSDEKDCKKEGFDWSNVGSVAEVKAKIQEYMKEHPDIKDEILESQSTTRKFIPDVQDIKNLLGQTEPPGKQSIAGNSEQLSALKSPQDEIPAESVTPSETPDKTPDDKSAAVDSVVEIKDSNGTASAVEDEAVVEKKKGMSAETSTRSAVIALSLSLTLTIVLIAFLGCRYKNMKTRVGRRGRPFRGSEVDYLIDGMYM